MNMNRAFFLKKEDRDPQWILIDASGQVLGRLATQIAEALRGKNRPEFTPHTDSGDYIVVINAEKIELTGNKWQNKTYETYSGWIGGLKVRTAEEMMAKHPTKLIEEAVEGMLPKNRLSRQIIKKLKVYAGPEHPHQAQVETTLKKA
jgi:large subunit ribosomal protein L13